MKLLGTTALVSAVLLLGTPAMAADIIEEPVVEESSGWYASIHGGYKFGEEWDDDIGIFSECFDEGTAKEVCISLDAEASVDTDGGPRIGGAIGYQLNGMLAIEGELGWMRQDFDEATLESLVLSVDTPTDDISVDLCDIPGVDCPTFGLGGDVSILTAMVNAILGFPVGGVIRPYVGVGVGAAWVNINDVTIDGVSGWRLDDSDTNLAVQAMAGVDVGLTENIALGVRGRVLHVGDVEVEDSSGFDHELDPGLFKSIEAVLTFGF